MFLLNKTEHALITVYGEHLSGDLAKMITACIPDRDLKILTPRDPETLETAAQNSAMTIIGLDGQSDSNLSLGRRLKENRLVTCDIVAFCGANYHEPDLMKIMAHCFDVCITHAQAQSPDFKTFLMHKIISGSKRLSSMILEEEYRRLCDAMSAAPASMIIFDADKRAVFISDHYFRTYPRIAPRLVRGLSVYDAFDMMAREEGLDAADPLYERLKNFWYALDESIEFTLANGTSYRLKAVQLPSRRGTVLMGQNVTGYERARSSLEEQARKLRSELDRIADKIPTA